MAELPHVLSTSGAALVLSRNRFEVDAQRTQFAIQVCSFHANALRELPHLAIAQYQLLLQVGTLELFTRFP